MERRMGDLEPDFFFFFSNLGERKELGKLLFAKTNIYLTLG